MVHGAGFFDKIKQFNELYRVDSNETPVYLGIERLEQFKSILLEEVSEIDELINQAKTITESSTDQEKLAILTSLSDWLGDIIVYCASEGRRWGIDISAVLDIIMQSNFSKLGADGKPLYDDRGKILKGPGYWKPEPKIREFLEGYSRGPH